jgi:hypothetical protein
MKSLSQNTCSLNQDFNYGPAKYEAGLLTIQPQCSVIDGLHREK